LCCFKKLKNLGNIINTNLEKYLLCHVTTEQKAYTVLTLHEFPCNGGISLLSLELHETGDTILTENSSWKDSKIPAYTVKGINRNGVPPQL
jgi:hypothetical protein